MRKAKKKTKKRKIKTEVVYVFPIAEAVRFLAGLDKEDFEYIFRNREDMDDDLVATREWALYSSVNYNIVAYLALTQRDYRLAEYVKEMLGYQDTRK